MERTPIPGAETRNDRIVTGSALDGGVPAGDNARAMFEAVRRARAEVAMAGVTKEGE